MNINEANNIISAVQKLLINSMTCKNSINIIYGSIVESSIGLDIDPRDIDIMVINNVYAGDDFKSRYGSFQVEFSIVDLEGLVHEIYNEPKMLLCKSTMDIESYFDISYVRSSVSNVCSKAYNKGKKKLIIEEDYHEYLGLKNLWHSVKFPYFAKWKFIDKNIIPQDDINYLNSIKRNIFESYNKSEGTLIERFESVNSWLKPEFNKIMTEFRKNFPKG